MNLNDMPERIVLERHLLRVSVRDPSLVLTVELRDVTDRVVKAAQTRLVRGQHLCEFDLRQMAEGLFSVHTKPVKRDAFGARLVKALREHSRTTGRTPDGRFAVLARSGFAGPNGPVQAKLLCDLEQRKVLVGLSSTAGAPQSMVKPRNSPVRADAAERGQRHASTAPIVASLTKELDTKMWGGFSVPARLELARIQKDTSAPLGERIGAAWSLARWHAYQHDFDRVLEAITSMHAIAGSRIVSKMVALLEAESLCELDRSREAGAMLDRAISTQAVFDPDLCLASANCYLDDAADDDRRLGLINEVFRRAGVATIA